MEERIIRMPAEWGGVVPTEAFLEEGRKIVDAASKAKIPLRLIGGVAIRVHSGDFVEFAKKLSRLGPGEQEYTGLDFMSYVKFRDALRRKSARVRHHNSSSNRSTCNLGIVARDGEITYMSTRSESGCADWGLRPLMKNEKRSIEKSSKELAATATRASNCSARLSSWPL